MKSESGLQYGKTTDSIISEIERQVESVKKQNLIPFLLCIDQCAHNAVKARLQELSGEQISEETKITEYKGMEVKIVDNVKPCFVMVYGISHARFELEFDSRDGPGGGGFPG